MQAKLIAIIVFLSLLAGVGATGYIWGNRHGTNAEKVKTQVAEIARKDMTINVLQDRIEESEKLAESQRLAAQQESKNHAKELETVRRRAATDRARRVPIDPEQFCAGRTAGKAEAAAPGSDGQADAGTAFLPEPFASDLRQLAAGADEVAADLRTLKARSEACFAGP